MIFTAIGVPGRFAERCENLLCRLAAANGSDPAFIGVNTLQELGAHLLADERLQAVMVARQPHADITGAIRDSGKPFLIALEEPQACVAALIQYHNVAYLDAVRATASALSCILPLMDATGALVLRASDHADMTALATEIAAHFQLTVDAKNLAAIAASVERDLPWPDNRTPPPYDEQPEPESALFDAGFSRMLPDLLAGALQPAWTALAEGPQEIHWHRDLFRAADHPGGVPPVLDVTGLGRCLLFGPYIHLPPGSWSCSLTLGCSQRAVGLKLIADIFAANVLGRVSFEISEPGFFEIEFSCVLPSQDHPVEIRLFNAEPAFEGHIALIQAVMKPLKATRIPVKIV